MIDTPPEFAETPDRKSAHRDAGNRRRLIRKEACS
jgi:hypothetical protein